MLRIGIPRALFYYSYFPFCKTFFGCLGARVVVSDETNKAILHDGLKAGINELCIPIKLLYGHVLNLKGRVDYVFLPHIITLDKVTYICPKLIASPDMVRCMFSGTPLLAVDIDMNSFYTSLYTSLKEVAVKLDASLVKIVAAYKEAAAAQERFQKLLEKGYLFDEAVKGRRKPSASDGGNGKGPTLAVVGHPYVINERYVTSGLIEKLKAMGAKVLTSDTVSQQAIQEALSSVEKIPHWTLGSRVLGSAIHLAGQSQVDGLIYVSPFGCSPDSLVKDTMEAHLRGKKPFLSLTVDEHASDTGLVTRIEAFMDMLGRTA